MGNGEFKQQSLKVPLGTHNKIVDDAKKSNRTTHGMYNHILTQYATGELIGKGTLNRLLDAMDTVFDKDVDWLKRFLNDGK